MPLTAQALIAKRKSSSVILTNEFAERINAEIGSSLPDGVVLTDLYFKSYKRWAEFCDSLDKIEKGPLTTALRMVAWRWKTVGSLRNRGEIFIPRGSIIIPGEHSIAFMVRALKKGEKDGEEEIGT